MYKNHQFFIALTFVSALSCNAQKDTVRLNGQTYELKFMDGFDGASLDESKWDYRTDSKHWSTQQEGNIAIANGHLQIHLKKETAGGKEYTGGGIISKALFGYGYYEAAMKVPKGAGWHTSFWLMRHSGSGGTDPDSTAIEIDIVENDSKDSSIYFSNVHRWEQGHINLGRQRVSAPLISESFQVVACEYTPEMARFYLNGRQVSEIIIKDLPQGKMHIWLTSIASQLGGTKAVDDSSLPSSATFDYVKYYGAMAPEQ